MFKFFEFITEAIGWLLIVISPLLIGLGIGAAFYFSEPGTFRLVLGILIAAYGLILGAVLATSIWKKKGTIHFLSRISATPELDAKELESNEELKSENQFLSKIQKKYFIIIASLLLITTLINIVLFPPNKKNVSVVDNNKNTEQVIPKDTLKINSEIKFPIYINLSMPETDSTGGIIEISKNGISCATIYPKGKETIFSLDLDKYYLLKFSKNGFTSKVVYFDTKVPVGREKEEFAKFTVDVELKKTPKGRPDKIKTVGGVKYDSIIGDFDKSKN